MISYEDNVPLFGCFIWVIHSFITIYLGYYFTATKLRHFSDVNIGISIPGRRETSDLLNIDGDKNDYDWWAIFLICIVVECYNSDSNCLQLPFISHEY